MDISIGNDENILGREVFEKIINAVKKFAMAQLKLLYTIPELYKSSAEKKFVVIRNNNRQRKN